MKQFNIKVFRGKETVEHHNVVWSGTKEELEKFYDDNYYYRCNVKVEATEK